MKRIINKTLNKIILTILLILIIGFIISCQKLDYEQLIVGYWKLETIITYIDGEESIFILKENSYFTKNNDDEYLEYHNKGPIVFWFNEYGERVIQGKDREQIDNFAKYRIDNDKLFCENPKVFQKLLGKEFESTIELLNKKNLRFSTELTTFHLDPNSNKGKWVYTFSFSKIKPSK